jgi:hypothetical protein
MYQRRGSKSVKYCRYHIWFFFFLQKKFLLDDHEIEMVENNVPIPKHVPQHWPPPLPKERQKLEELVSKSRIDNAAANSSEEPSKPCTSATLELWIPHLNVLFILFYQTKLFVLSSFRTNSLSGTNPLFQKQLQQFEITMYFVCMKWLLVLDS